MYEMKHSRARQRHPLGIYIFSLFSVTIFRIAVFFMLISICLFCYMLFG